MPGKVEDKHTLVPEIPLVDACLRETLNICKQREPYKNVVAFLWLWKLKMSREWEDKHQLGENICKKNIL